MPHKVEPTLLAKSLSPRPPVPQLLRKLLKRTIRKVRERALRKLTRYGALKKPLEGVGRSKAVIVACAYRNPMSRANTLGDGPLLRDAVIAGPSVLSMILDVKVQSEDPMPMEIVLQLDGEPTPRGQGPLKHAHRDGRNLRELLQTKYGFSDIEYLSDDNNPDHIEPTAENIKSAIRRMVDGARAGDSLVFAFIGHGGQKTNTDGTEVDDLDEMIFAVDQDDTIAAIVDDELHDILVKPLPSGCKLTAIIDACHSGTPLDLKWTNEYPNDAYSARSPAQGKASQASNATAVDSENSPTETRAMRPYDKKPIKRKSLDGKFMFRRQHDSEFSSDMHKVAKAKVFCFSACRDNQETFEWGRGYTMTHLLVETIKLHEEKSRKACILQRKLFAKLSHYFDKVHRARPEYPKQLPQLGSNMKRRKWNGEPFIAHPAQFLPRALKSSAGIELGRKTFARRFHRITSGH